MNNNRSIMLFHVGQGYSSALIAYILYWRIRYLSDEPSCYKFWHHHEIFRLDTKSFV